VSVQDVAVLVIEDEYAIRKSLGIMLGDAGYTVYEAPDGMSGLTRLRTLLTPLIVLLDWRMPGMDGLEVLHAMATDAPIAQRHAYILLTAGYDDPELMPDAFPTGITVSIMGKPFTMNRLLRTVAAAADHLAHQRVPAQDVCKW
jgi:CheY-like chemotaxis protein